VEIVITKHRLAVNWYLLILLSVVTVNMIVHIVMMAILGPQTKFVMGFALSFVGMFLYGFHYWEGRRILYYKKVKTKVDIGPIDPKTQSTEPSKTFVTEEGKLLF
jgi:hypothetical protein